MVNLHTWSTCTLGHPVHLSTCTWSSFTLGHPACFDYHDAMMDSQNPTMVSPEEMKQNAKTEFEAWAGSYDRSLLNHFLFRPSYIMLMEEIARWYVEHRCPFRVLDIGCATGTLTGLLARSGWSVEVVGLDYAENMCHNARQKAMASGVSDTVRFVNADSEELPFATESFDIITCSNSFHHYPNQQRAVCEMHRLLTPGGRLIIIDGFRDCVIGWFVYDVIIDRIEHQVHHAPWPVVHGYYEQAGLQDIRRRKFNFLFPAFATIGDK